MGEGCCGCSLLWKHANPNRLQAWSESTGVQNLVGEGYVGG